MVFTSIHITRKMQTDSSLSKQKPCHRITAAGHVIREWCRKGTFDFTKIETRMYVKLRDLFLFFLRNYTNNLKNIVTVISYAVLLVTAVKKNRVLDFLLSFFGQVA